MVYILCLVVLFLVYLGAKAISKKKKKSALEKGLNMMLIVIFGWFLATISGGYLEFLISGSFNI